MFCPPFIFLDILVSINYCFSGKTWHGATLQPDPVVDNTIHRINRYPGNTGSEVCFANTYPLDSDLWGLSG